jgi:hypothetical protein
MGAIHEAIIAMRFNDYHKQVCATLKLDAEYSRRFRTFMIRCYTRGHSANMCLGLLQKQPDIKQLMLDRAQEAARESATS